MYTTIFSLILLSASLITGTNYGGHKNQNNVEDEGWSELHEACCYGNIDEVKDAIKNGADINSIACDNTTPLYSACRNNNEEIVLYLLDNSACILFPDDTIEDTPFYAACTIDDPRILNILLSYENAIATDDAYAADREKLFEVLCKNSNFEHIKVFLQYGATFSTINATIMFNRTRATLLHYAAMTDDVDFISLLIKAGADSAVQDSDGFTPLHAACYYEGILDVESESAPELVKAVKALLDHGADAYARDNDGHIPLYCAYMQNHPIICKMILKADNSILTDSAKAQDLALFINTLFEKDDRDMLITLLDNADRNGANHIAQVPLCNQDNVTLIHHACKENDLSLVKALVEKGADITRRDESGKTLLHYICQENYDDTLFFIPPGETPENSLFIMDRIEKPALITYLVEHGIFVNAGDTEGNTILHNVCENGCIPLIKLCLALGGSLYKRNTYGYTPLENLIEHCQENEIDSDEILREVIPFYQDIEQMFDQKICKGASAKKEAATAYKALL